VRRAPQPSGEGCPEAPVDLIVAEIGSTTTIVTAWEGVRAPDAGARLLGQGMAATTALAGDVTRGLEAALHDLGRRLGRPHGIRWHRMLASSSAAGGLRMSVHGLVHDMTVRAAREAALGAGAVLRMVTSGPLTASDLERLAALRPNIILLAGGVDWGERETVTENARLIARRLQPPVPVVFAGNAAATEDVVAALAERGFPVRVVENVYPQIDDLNVGPARRAIQEVFEEHIVEAPGMGRIRELVDGRIVPTPGAVMAAAELLYSEVGDVLVVDVGGATTDVHSVTPGSEEIARLLAAPEPVAKRTVEGDLGVYRNARHARALVPEGRLEQLLGVDAAAVDAMVDALPPLPERARDIEIVVELTRAVTLAAVGRHAGRLRHLYGPTGRTTVAEGKDLTRVRWIVGTGGALTRLPGGRDALAAIADGRGRGRDLWPAAEARILLDQEYIMATCGVMSREYPAAAMAALRRSLGIEGSEG
jgi:uncharacterized protein (TIGR01319 family)